MGTATTLHQHMDILFMATTLPPPGTLLQAEHMAVRRLPTERRPPTASLRRDTARHRRTRMAPMAPLRREGHLRQTALHQRTARTLRGTVVHHQQDTERRRMVRRQPMARLATVNRQQQRTGRRRRNHTVESSERRAAWL